jgi:hypothetical protein
MTPTRTDTHCLPLDKVNICAKVQYETTLRFLGLRENDLGAHQTQFIILRSRKQTVIFFHILLSARPTLVGINFRSLFSIIRLQLRVQHT